MTVTYRKGCCKAAKTGKFEMGRDWLSLHDSSYSLISDWSVLSLLAEPVRLHECLGTVESKLENFKLV